MPSINTDAHDFMGLKYQDGLSRFMFTDNAKNIRNVTGIYVYKGDKNQNWSLVLDLMKAKRDLRFDKKNNQSDFVREDNGNTYGYVTYCAVIPTTSIMTITATRRTVGSSNATWESLTRTLHVEIFGFKFFSPLLLQLLFMLLVVFDYVRHKA